jgi:hypothetical protein
LKKDDEPELLRPAEEKNKKYRLPKFLPVASLDRGAVMVIHALSVLAVLHLGWVSFVLKKQTNQIPEQLSTTALLFASVYLIVLLKWIITVPFFEEVDQDADVAVLINRILFKSIGYISPFKASEYTSKYKLNFSGGMRVSGAIRDCYYNEAMIVFAILFYYFLFSILMLPQKAVNVFPVLGSGLGFFGIVLIAFYGAGAVTIALLFRIVCSSVDKYARR